MSHTRIDAPKGFMYHRKGTSDDYASIVFIGGGRTIVDYELVPEEEYKEFLAEQEKANEPI